MIDQPLPTVKRIAQMAGEAGATSDYFHAIAVTDLEEPQHTSSGSLRYA